MKCPGQDTQYWKPGAIFEVNCPQCDGVVEFFKDDTARRCGHCGHRFVNPKMDFGCAAYCQFADQCIGDLPPELIAQKQDLLKDRVAIEVKRYFKTDFNRIGHATRVARHAENIAKAEGGNLAIVLVAAYLRGIAQTEGSQTVRAILERLGADPALITAVCDIVQENPSTENEDARDMHIVLDADRLETLDQQRKDGRLSDAQLREQSGKYFLTPSGKTEAEKLLLR